MLRAVLSLRPAIRMRFIYIFMKDISTKEIAQMCRARSRRVSAQTVARGGC
jgi:DNA-directed RNA polymerase specialized sigma24 family protein